MKKSKIFIKFSSMFVTIVVLFTCGQFQSLAASMDSGGLQPPVLQKVPREYWDSNQPVETVLQEVEQPLENISDKQSRQVLTQLETDVSHIEKMELVEDQMIGRTSYRVEFSNAEVQFDEDGNLIDYINYQDIPNPESPEKLVRAQQGHSDVYMLTMRNQMDPVIEELEQMLQLQDYLLVECNTTVHESVWTLVWYRDLGDGLLNPYDMVNAFVDSKDGSLMTFGRNQIQPNATEPLVTKEQALDFAQPVLSLFEQPETLTTDLTYFRPNFYWEENGPLYEEADFIRLAWKLEIGTAAVVYIDALTGEILGGGETQGPSARAMCAETGFKNSQSRIEWAANAFRRLGYEQPYGFQPVNQPLVEDDIRWVLEYNGSVGLYLACHGEQISGTNVHQILGYLDKPGVPYDARWTVRADSVDEIFHLVFLDACLSSNQACVRSWLNAFHIGGIDSDTAFVGWNISVQTGIAAAFCQRFWPKVGNYTVYDSVILALKETQAIHGVGCNPGFEGDPYYYGTAWL